MKKAILLGAVLSLSLSMNIVSAAEKGDDNKVKKPRGGEDSGGGIKKSRSKQIKQPYSKSRKLTPDQEKNLSFLIVSEEHQKSVNANSLCVYDSTDTEVVYLKFKNEETTYFTADLNQSLLGCLTNFNKEGLCMGEELEAELEKSEGEIYLNGPSLKIRTLDDCGPLNGEL